MKRRSFMQKTGITAAAGSLLPELGKDLKANTVSSGTQASPLKNAFLRVEGNRIHAETETLIAVIEKGLIISLKSKTSGEEFITSFDVNASAAIQLIYSGGGNVNVNEEKFGSIETRQLSPTRAEVLFHSWDGDGVLAVTVDPERGDLLLEPSGYSSRPGVRACRWNLKGLKPELLLIAPFFQGVKLPLADTLIRDTHWTWAMYWEAAFAILQSGSGGFWIHTRDNRYRYKALKAGTEKDPNVLGFDSEAYGPLDNNLSAGGVEWRINVYAGDWKVPAGDYRAWYWKAYDLEREERKRQPWIHDVKFAISWCPGEAAILDALAQKLKPEQVLLHYPNWRSDNYDENYPAYAVSEAGRAFIKRAKEMGFRIMPHFNAIDMDPSHPVYDRIRDFQFRSLEDKKLLGWSWFQGRGIGVPESNVNRTRNRDKKVMVKVHPGLAMWRSILGENILKAAKDLSLETVFIDVTLHCLNIHNSIVESTTVTEGMKRLISHVADLGTGLVVGGEGLNEITAQGQSFAQAHLFKSWQSSIEGLERAGGCDLNTFLFGKLCRTIGYSGLSGRNENEALRMRIHNEHGTIPTVTIRRAEEILNPNPAVKEMLKLAAS